MSFTIAIIGRPNVGKSTLFNRLVGQKLALVDDLPGVTRDRREGEARLGDLAFTIIDTAGLDEGAKGSLTARMQEQTEAAIAQADALFFVIDARIGLTPTDRAFADFARKADKPVLLVANKSEGKHGDAGAMEAFALGLGDPIQISAEHGEGMGELYDALRELMPEPVDEDEAEDDEPPLTEEEAATRPIRVAIVGRPNAGKSTLINHLLGEERLLTSPEAGTTRDSIAVEINWNGRDFRVFDTAGLRRRSRIEEKLEKLSVADALRAVRFAEVVVMMMDTQNRFEEQDLRIADLIEREGRAVVLAVNKWDLMETKGGGAISGLRRDADHWLPADQGRSDRRRIRSDGRWHRSADAGDPGRLRRLEQARADFRAQSLVRAGRAGQSAAGRVRPTAQAQLHHAEQGATAELRAVLLARGRGAAVLFALPDQFHARDL
ncbi:GTP-binding protein [Bradyrhizobium japonicum]